MVCSVNLMSLQLHMHGPWPGQYSCSESSSSMARHMADRGASGSGFNSLGTRPFACASGLVQRL